MGLGNSRLRSRNHRPRINCSSSLSSILLCGASSSRVAIQMEEHCELNHEAQNPRLELSSDLNTGEETSLRRNRNSNFRVSDGYDGSSRCSNHRASSSSTLFKQRRSLDDTIPLDVSANNPNVVNGLGGDSAPADNRAGEQTAVGSFGSDSIRPFGSETIEEVASSGLGFLVSQVDVLSISSNVLLNSNSNSNGGENNREARRRGRRMIWDAFSRRSSGRVPDSPTYVFSMEDHHDGVGPRDGWVFGLSGDLFDNVDGSDSGYQRHSRSEVWERLRSGFGESGRRTTSFCPSGIHLDGTCSCESLLINEESNTRSSISRIVMLAEALFEVVDEIHRQPVSLSLSMVSSPASSSLVDSFPLKSHSKISNRKGCEDISECYICLAEYEEGDKIRVLPCHHEYHMSCVDKWLKEIHGVCPLCRGDVREGLTDCSVSNSEISV